MIGADEACLFDYLGDAVEHARILDLRIRIGMQQVCEHDLTFKSLQFASAYLLL